MLRKAVNDLSQRRIPSRVFIQNSRIILNGIISSQKENQELVPGDNNKSRNFFKTHAEQVMKPINVETLMGHSTGISDSYYRPNERELLEDYLKAIPELTILPENQQYLQLRKQEERISELERNHAKIKDLEEGVNLLGGLFAEQLVKANIRRELDHPTHRHTKKQIESLKKYSSSPPLPEAWEVFLNWAKKEPVLYSDKKSNA